FVAAAYSPAIMVHQRFVFRIGSSCVQDHGPAAIWVFYDQFGVAMPLDDFHPEDVSENGKSLLKAAAFIVTFDQLGFFQHRTSGHLIAEQATEKKNSCFDKLSRNENPKFFRRLFVRPEPVEGW